jgi:Virulence activator alpha C-term
LADLAERGLIERGETGPRDRQPFEITRQGRAAFRDWVNAKPEPENLRIPLLLRLTFADDIEPEELRQTLADHRAVHALRLEDYRQLDLDLATGGVAPEQRVTLAYGIAYESAVLGWFDQLPEQLTGREARRQGSARAPGQQARSKTSRGR